MCTNVVNLSSWEAMRKNFRHVRIQRGTVLTSPHPSGAVDFSLSLGIESQAFPRHCIGVLTQLRCVTDYWSIVDGLAAVPAV